MLGTLFCGLAPNYEFLLAARIFTGIFGGVIGSISFAIIADLFPLSMRGRVAGLVQASFAAAQVMGLPIGLYLANHFGWHSPFLMIVGVAIVAGISIVLKLQPVTAHIAANKGRNPVKHLIKTATTPRYVVGFSATMLLAVGGFMIMPFGSTFVNRNLGLPMDKLPMLYMINGAFAMVAGPLVGRLSDAFGKYKTFVVGTILSSIMLVFYTGLKEATLPLIVATNVLLFMGISGRMVSAFALGSALPAMPDRGAYMSINSSLQQFSGGVASWVAGLIVIQANPDAPLEHYNIVGWVAASVGILTLFLMYRVHRLVAADQKEAARVAAAPKVAA